MLAIALCPKRRRVREAGQQHLPDDARARTVAGLVDHYRWQGLRRDRLHRRASGRCIHSEQCRRRQYHWVQEGPPPVSWIADPRACAGAPVLRICLLGGARGMRTCACTGVHSFEELRSLPRCPMVTPCVLRCRPRSPQADGMGGASYVLHRRPRGIEERQMR